MKPSSSNSRNKGHAETRREAREELDQETRDRKRQRKRYGRASDSRAAGGNTTSDSKGQDAPKDPRTGSKAPIPLGVTEKVTKQHKPRNEKPTLSSQAELELLETDERLGALLERLEVGETLSAKEQFWMDAKLDHIDELMQKPGLSYDDDEEEREDERQEDMMRPLQGS